MGLGAKPLPGIGGRKARKGADLPRGKCIYSGKFFSGVKSKLYGFFERETDRADCVLKNNISQMVYKHAISTVVPVKPIANFIVNQDEA